MPVILVGNGTGIAPFRAFWQQRMFDMNNKCPPKSAITGQRQWGDIRLFFGCRNPQHDDIYHDELQNAVENKALTRVSTGYSRDKKKLKVNRLNSARVTGFIERGSRYVTLPWQQNFCMTTNRNCLLKSEFALFHTSSILFSFI